jgi:uncharacterized protein YcfL
MTHALRSRVSTAFIGVAVLIGPMLCGCQQDQMKGPPGAQQDPFPGANYPRVAVEGQMQKWVAADYERVIVTDPTPDSPLRVDVPLRSLADLEMYAQYQFQWFDAQGRKVGESGWKSVTLEPRLQSILSANATTSKATDWRLELRSAR